MSFMKRNFNWYGHYTFYKKENKRFCSNYNQTIIGPVVSGIIFFAVLMITVGKQNMSHWPLPYKDFIVCGLVIQIMLQASFEHTSFSLVVAKVVGYIEDLLFPPLNSTGILVAYLASALTRAVTVGTILLLLLCPFTQIKIWNIHIWTLIYFIFVSSSMLSLLGVITGIFSNNFEQASVISQYTIMPLSFLSCIFYPLKNLPEIVQKINLCNPFFYLVDGFRYALTGHSDASIVQGIMLTTTIVIAMLLVAKILLDKGYRIKK